MKRSIVLTSLIFLISLLPLTAEIEFSDIELARDDLLNFNLSVEYPGFGKYKTLFLSDLKSENLSQLTFFPEKVVYLDDTGQFQIQNRFGVFRTDSTLKGFQSIDIFASFVKSQKVERGKILPIQSSPDGEFLVYVKPVSYAYGDLALYHVSKKKETIISNNIEISLGREVALWSRDSKFVVYSKEGQLYYYSIEHLNENRVFAEYLRKIGKGVLENVSWGNEDDLYYVSDFLIYRIGTREFFTRALYKDILRIGTILGKIPFLFDPNFDRFWMSPDGNKILLNKGGRNLFLYFLTSEDFVTAGDIQSLPYLYLPRNSLVSKVIWSAGDQITVLTRNIIRGVKKTSIFRLTIPKDIKTTSFRFEDTGETGIQDILLNPGSGDTVALLKNDRVEFLNYAKWERKYSLLHPSPVSAIWKDGDEIFIAGAYYTELYNLTQRSSSLISISQAGKKGFSKDGKSIFLMVNDLPYKINLETRVWERATTFDASTPNIVSNSYRVYLTDSTSGSYSNMVMVRNIKADSFGTFPLFDLSRDDGYEAFQEKDDTIDFYHFSHGSRIRRRELSLVFNVVDSIEGVPTILDTLADYGLKCTFFVNGEAIKRYSGAVKEIADSGHEVGSLFYAYFNMVDSKYDLDKNFIKMGLAINEDDYFNATGKELALLWHAPYYFINTNIISASRDMGYIYVGRDVDSMDWVTRDTASSYSSGIYLSASGLVEKVLKEKKPGSIIPILGGIPVGDRDDYLFQKLDILINSLMNLGYDIVPVSSLIERSR